MTIEIRPAKPADREAITALHIRSMQEAYGTFLPATYLQEVVPEDRRTLWASRFASLDSTRYIIRVVHPADGTLAGFICLTLDEADTQGTLLDNLHVAAAFRRQRLGHQMLAAALLGLPASRAEIPLHLLVYAQNMVARRFYDRLGGTVIEEISRDFGERRVIMLRYGWQRPALLFDSLGETP